MNNEFKVTESFGTATQIERLTDEAIGIARATGSVGATASESKVDNETLKSVESARVTVSRI